MEVWQNDFSTTNQPGGHQINNCSYHCDILLIITVKKLKTCTVFQSKHKWKFARTRNAVATRADEGTCFLFPNYYLAFKRKKSYHAMMEPSIFRHRCKKKIKCLTKLLYTKHLRLYRASGNPLNLRLFSDSVLRNGT